MKKNNKGFVVSAVLYPLLVLFLALIMGLLAMTDTRKRILDKMKLEISNSIMDEVTCSCDTIINKLNYLIKNGTGGGGGYIGSSSATIGDGGGIRGYNSLYGKGAHQIVGYAFGYGEDGVYKYTNEGVAGGESGYFGGSSPSKGANVYGTSGALNQAIKAVARAWVTPQTQY